MVDSPSYANKEYTTNPIAGDQVSFQVPVRNYSLIPASNVAVSFYAVPMTYDGTRARSPPGRRCPSAIRRPIT